MCVTRIIRSLQATASTLKSPAVKRLTMIEVEQKFVINPSIDDALCRIGATLVKEVSLQDTYYDDENFVLMTSDHWLRLRNEQWQLKFPISTFDSSAPSSSSSATRYHDIDDVDTILPKVANLLGTEVTDDSSLQQLQQLLHKRKLAPVLKFVSHRRTFTCPGGCSVDLDITDFGFSVGEIEKVVDNESQVEDALRDIEELAANLGVTEKVRQGKIDAYLSLFNPVLLARLIETGVLCKP